MPSRSSTPVLLVVLHWASVVAITVSVLSGLRIAADDPDSVVSRFVAPITLYGQVHEIHALAGLAVVSVALAYVAYMWFGAHGGRLRIPPRPRQGGNRRLTWRRRNLIVYRVMFALIAVMGVTGGLLYFDWIPSTGAASWWLQSVHLASAWGVLAMTLLHVVAQYMFGAAPAQALGRRLRQGLDWLLKMLRPRAERAGHKGRLLSRPAMVLAATAAIGAAAGASMLRADTTVYIDLPLANVAPTEAPRLDGRTEDAVWTATAPARVMTREGINLPGGESLVEVRAAQDGEHIYFLFRWQDPTRSYKHLPLIKTAAGWRLLHEEYDIEDEDLYYEDKFAVLLSLKPVIGGGVTHLGPRPLAGRPGGLSGRGLHYTTDGSIADMWQWKSVRSQPLGGLDDDFFGPPVEPKEAEIAGTARYKGGYVTDPGTIGSANNFKHEGPGGYRGEVIPLRLPADHAALARRLGPLNPGPEADAQVPWAMYEGESADYTPELDAAIPVGAIVPGVLIKGQATIEGDRGDVHTAAEWRDGWWTLETRRRLDTGSPNDVAIAAGIPVYLWVSVFDASQTRHSRHMRPLRLMMAEAAGS
ncbi:MAG: ethylbenzene dehydrogenase-related protein [Inquilinaceae bacterium]